MSFLKGQFLIASPALRDSNFAQSVVLMLQHDDEGALGLIINRPSQLNLKELWEKIGKEPCELETTVHVGGPCEGTLMVLHTHKQVAQDAVIEGVYFSTVSEHIEWLADHAEEPVRFIANYAGWSPGQLESEIETDSWLTLPATADAIFSHDENLWERLLLKHQLATSKSERINPKLVPRDPSMN